MPNRTRTHALTADAALIEALEVGSYLIVPKLTTTQRDALSATNGLIIYNTTLNKFQGYESGAWANLI